MQSRLNENKKLRQHVVAIGSKINTQFKKTKNLETPSILYQRTQKYIL